ncbi:MAG: hypothetical protein CMK49_01530 [Prochlorococcus sp. SP3034]|nr:hypothetical protein [Prochlorococcus sp. SP3034]
MSEGNIFLDLRLVPCPLNVVKCKLALEKLKQSRALIVYLDLGEPEEMVKHSLEKEGYKCTIVEKNTEYIIYSIAYEFS